MIRPPAPPRLAVAFLEATLPGDLAEPVIGDLFEEFAMRAARERRTARAWFYRQVFYSAVPLALLSLRRADPRVAAAGVAASGLFGSAALVVFRGLWVRVLVQVPLRAGHDPTAGWIFFGAALIAASAALGALCGAAFSRRAFQGGKQ